MEYNFKCRKCGNESKRILSGFNPDGEQSYIITCKSCGKKTERTFPTDFEIDKFYKSLKGRARLVFQKYGLEKKSFRQTSKDTGIPRSTCHRIYTTEIGLGARSFRQSLKNYWRQQNETKRK